MHGGHILNRVTQTVVTRVYSYDEICGMMGLTKELLDLCVNCGLIRKRFPGQYPFSEQVMAAKHALALLTFDIDDTLYSSTEFARLARENSLKAMIAAGLKIDLKAAIAELDEVVAEFSSNDEHHFDRMLERVPSTTL